MTCILIRPFAGLRPAPGLPPTSPPRPTTCCPPTRRACAPTGKPWSFLHISKPEIDLPPGTDPYAPEVYAKAAENLQKMLAAGVLVRDPAPCYYAYRLIMGSTQPDRPGGGRLGGRLRHQPHPQARVHPPRQGRRPGAPDRRAQRPDRAGAAGLPRRAGGGRHSGRRPAAGAAGRRRHRRRRHPPHHLGDSRCGYHRRS